MDFETQWWKSSQTKWKDRRPSHGGLSLLLLARLLLFNPFKEILKLQLVGSCWSNGFQLWQWWNVRDEEDRDVEDCYQAFDRSNRCNQLLRAYHVPFTLLDTKHTKVDENLNPVLKEHTIYFIQTLSSYFSNIYEDIVKTNNLPISTYIMTGCWHRVSCARSYVFLLLFISSGYIILELSGEN